MTNKEKAEEIAANVQKNLFFNSTKECIDSARAMAEWKDEEFAEEKQELIDKACGWLYENLSLYIDHETEGHVDYDNLIIDYENLFENLRKNIN